uniref:DNA primase small subunit isoform X1 n=2 Tax=Myxine glutinosa TaxID=7769 RepID=UPI00358FC535
MADADFCSAQLPDLLPLYYKRLFPFGRFFKWLNYGGVKKNYFQRREFSFTLKDDIYVRYQSFQSANEMEKEVHKAIPYKMDIGAVFSHRPNQRHCVKPSAFQAQEKELVFDIDMTDYDDVRTCCRLADICANCWPLMTLAMRVIDRALREDFGFKHRLWVYSGRRGVHCWVCDETARELSQAARSAIAEYLSLVKGGEGSIKKVNLSDPIHPSIQDALKLLRKDFDDYALVKQDFLGNEKKREKVLALMPDDLRSEMRSGFSSVTNSVNCWDRLKSFTQAKKAPDKWRHVHEEVMLQYCYPRLDVNVSKGVNHLLKSPFCVHPKTGRVCVPIDLNKVEDFDPFNVPTISQLCWELDHLPEVVDAQAMKVTEEGQKRRPKDYKKTSLAAAIRVFDSFLEDLEASWRGRLLNESDLKNEF